MPVVFTSNAWWALLAVAVPIVVHLLTRRRARKVQFPSLKFIPLSQLAALRTHTVAEWPLLFVRLLVAALAAVALAGPVFVSADRRASWNQRIARAIVAVAPDDPDVRSLVASEQNGTFATAQFTGLTVADAVRDATTWLSAQPPAARELVVAGDLREGALTASDLRLVPPHIGIRFLPVPSEESAVTVELRAIADAGVGQWANYDVQVSASLGATSARYEIARQPASIRIVAATAEQAHADALLRAVLRNGVMLGRHADREVRIAFRGSSLAGDDRLRTPGVEWMREALAAVPDVRGGDIDGALVVLVPSSALDPSAPGIVARVLRAAYHESLDTLEPRRISVDRLAAWSRPYGPSPPDITPQDEGDGRWLWAVVLLLLGLEQILRRREEGVG